MKLDKLMKSMSDVMSNPDMKKAFKPTLDGKGTTLVASDVYSLLSECQQLLYCSTYVLKDCCFSERLVSVLACLRAYEAFEMEVMCNRVPAYANANAAIARHRGLGTEFDENALRVELATLRERIPERMYKDKRAGDDVPEVDTAFKLPTLPPCGFFVAKGSVALAEPPMHKEIGDVFRLSAPPGMGLGLLGTHSSFLKLPCDHWLSAPGETASMTSTRT